MGASASTAQGGAGRNKNLARVLAPDHQPVPKPQCETRVRACWRIDPADPIKALSPWS